VVIESDDPSRPQVVVSLAGRLRDNLPPRLCANLTRVQPGDGSALIRYDSPEDWAPLLVPPNTGYDFTATRDVQPKSVVTFSAHSSADTTTCTTDPEDERIGLTYSWELIAWPAGSNKPAVAGAGSPTASMAPIATGLYELRLQVKDAQDHLSQTTLRFAVALKQDLVVQLSWNAVTAASTGIDLDLHLVRPSATTPGVDFAGAFDPFDVADGTSGDINGYAVSAILGAPGAGLDFDWGQPGAPDDPRLNIDDVGFSGQLENISLNYPENDPACATADCAYKVMVHYYKDARTTGSTGNCQVTNAGGCVDGAACNCPSGSRCVALTAEKGTAPSGNGKCYVAPQPVVRIFFKSSAVPAEVIPLDTLNPQNPVEVGAPCQLLYIADVIWPAKDGSTGTAPRVVIQGTDPGQPGDEAKRLVAPKLARFGIRQTDSLQCSPNTGSGGQDDWYAQEPEPQKRKRPGANWPRGVSERGATEENLSGPVGPEGEGGDP
jgi:hypothetical protein